MDEPEGWRDRLKVGDEVIHLTTGNFAGAHETVQKVVRVTPTQVIITGRYGEVRFSKRSGDEHGYTNSRSLSYLRYADPAHVAEIRAAGKLKRLRDAALAAIAKAPLDKMERIAAILAEGTEANNATD